MTTVNFTKPVTSDLRADVLQYIRDFMAGQSKLFAGDTLVSPPTGLIRLGTNKLESWNGSAFVDYDLASQYFGSLSVQGDATFQQAGTGVGGVQVKVGSGGVAMRPNTSTGGWAYGVIAEKQSDGLRMAGAGWYGNNQTINGFFVGIDADWWSNWKLKITSSLATLNVNLGIGSDTPAWDATYKTLSLGTMAAIQGNNAGLSFTNNGYFDGANWKYITTAPLTMYFQYNGDNVWSTAVSGTAGANASPVQKMKLTLNASLLLGATGAALARDSNYAGFDIGTVGNGFQAIKDTSGAGFTLTQNVYTHTAGWKNVATGGGTAINFGLNGNAMEVFRAASGAADSAVTWTEIAVFNASKVRSNVNIQCGAESTGLVTLVPGGASNPGYIEFRTPDGTRRGYIGWADSSRLTFVAENSWTFHCASKFEFGTVATINPTGTWTTSGWGKAIAIPQSHVIQWLKGSYGYSWGMGLSGTSFYFTYSAADDGTQGPTYWLTVTAGGNATFALNTSAPVVYGTSYVYSYGNVYAQGDVIAYYSDERLKKRLGNIVGALEKVLALDGFRYRLNKKGRKVMNRPDDRAVQLAVSAQQVKRVAPEAVTLAPFDMAEDGTSKSGENYLTVKYERLIPLLIEAIKELNDKVDRL